MTVLGLSRKKWIAVAAVGVVATFGVVATKQWSKCPSGMLTSLHDECVGVIRDRDHIAPELQNLYDRLDTMNAEVDDSRVPYVYVVLLTPLVAPGRDQPAGMNVDQARGSLEGALVGLRIINAQSEFGSPTQVRVKMLLADHGTQQELTPDLADQIVTAGDADHPVVAVVGLGSSYQGTLATVKEIGTRQVPMVSALTSADTFSDGSAPALRNVSPANADHARAVKRFLDDERTGSHVGMIVADKNDDPFTATLRTAFERTLNSYTQYPMQTFNGETVRGAPPVDFSVDVTNMCYAVRPGQPQAPLNTVFFLGRLGDYKRFLEALDARVCKAERLLVIAVGSGFSGAAKFQDLMRSANVGLVYSTSTDVPAWTAGGPGTPEGFAPFVKRFRDFGFPDEDFADGLAIGYHDAVVTAGRAIHLAAASGKVQAAGVDTQLDNLNLAYSVRGASGTFCFARGVNGGRAMGKNVLLRQIGDTPLSRLGPGGGTYVTGVPC